MTKKLDYFIKGLVAILCSIISIFVIFEAIFKMIGSYKIAIFAVVGFGLNLIFAKIFLKNIDSEDNLFLKILVIMTSIYYVARFAGLESIKNAACTTAIFALLLFVVNRYQLEKFEVFVALVTIAAAITMI